MVFPYDVRGVYDAPPREVGDGPGNTKLRRSVSAWVLNDRIIFKATKPPEGEESTEVAVFSNNTDDTGYDDDNPDEWKSGNNPSVKIDHSVGTEDRTSPIVFVSLQKREKRTIPGGKEDTPLFTFQYKIALFDDKPWEFTKTTRLGGVPDWHTPVKTKPDDPDDPIKEDEGTDSN